MPEYCLIGEKLGHSFSTFLHWEFGNPDYELNEILKDKIDSYLQKADFKGINVTIPYKETAMKYCIPDDTAKEIGCVNTLVNRNGKVFGYNTDCLGFSFMVRNAGISLSGKNILILGSGGTSKTACYQCAKEGAKSITVLSRTGKSYKSVVNCPVRFASYEDENLYDGIDILVNTTPVGMFPDNNSSPVDIELFENLEGVVDVVYNPLVTKLVNDARKRNIKATNGLSMLVSQAYYAEKLFQSDCGYELYNNNIEKINSEDDDRIKLVLKRVIHSKRNYVLVGMPGSGKSTIGRLLSEHLHLNFLDTDVLFKETFDSEPGDYITNYGEKEFRDKEALVVESAAQKSGTIISTGGGSILRPSNVDALSANGIIIYLSRPINELSVKNRPLSKNGNLRKLYDERSPIYDRICDVKVEVAKTARDTMAAVLEAVENCNENFGY